MDTVRTEKHGELEVVIGFDKLRIDPVASARTGKKTPFRKRRGEHVVDAETLAELRAIKTGRFQALTLTGEIVPDYRGCRSWLKGSDGRWRLYASVRAKIGDPLPSGAVLIEDLTLDQNAEIKKQLEADRLLSLTPAEMETEKKQRLDAAAAAAATKRSALEIQGVSAEEALTQAKGFYSNMSKKIEKAYVR